MTDLIARDRAHVWHPYASVTTDSPLFEVVAARGSRLTLADGRELVDGMSSWWAAIHGYGHPELDAAVHAQVDRFAHVMFGGLTHAPAVELAELLVDITPPDLTKVFFADSGSVAVEVAIKMALQYWQGRGQPQRHLLLTVRGGYHGDTAGAMSVCDPVTGMHRLFKDYVSQQLFVDRPRPAFDAPVLPADLDEVRALLSSRGAEVAALVVEPVVQGAGGMWFYAPDYLRQLVELCREHGVLVLFDEIATGFGRTGRLFAWEHAGVVPDIMCVGKALTGGYLTLGATLCTQEVADGVCAPPGNALMHGPTFMANPLACSVALASVRLLITGPWQSRVQSIEAALREQLAPCRELPGVVDVRVLGAIGVVELRDPVDLAAMQPRLVDEGAWVRPFGRLVYTMPPYVIEPEELRVVTRAITTVLST
ncbi:MAG: adenosylmethionine---8-amino-7-oxononanoate aminotransferase [Actinomycetota bacterium]|nr:adenosylmethionine---8-amino-7-oxononanoate aminotransferase [Actinomycetota bacterium]